MDHGSHIFLNASMQHQKSTDWDSCASNEHTLMRAREISASNEQTLMRAREISAELCRLCLFDRQDSFNSTGWNEFENAETRVSGTAPNEHRLMRAREISSGTASNELTLMRAREISVSNEHTLMRAREISEELSRLRLFDRQTSFNSIDWDQFENEGRFRGTPKASDPMMHLTPATTTQRTYVKREPEPALSRFNFDMFDPSMDFFDLDCEPASPPAAKCAPLANKQKKRKTKATARSRRGRKRPFKNVREQQRRATIKDKLSELSDLCSSDAVTSIVPRPSSAIGLFVGGPHKPRKVDILCDSIHMLEAMDNELIKLRARNKKLKMHSCK